MIRPRRLQPGDGVALIAPAGPVTPERVDTALERCRLLGLEPVLGTSARESTGYLAGSDDRRRADFLSALDDGDIRAIWALRGGYGTMRILPRLPLARLAAQPRAFIGFSDNTAIHLALARHNVVSFHAPHAGAPEFTEFTETCFRRVLFEAEPAGVLPADAATPVRTLRDGVAEGALIGGNLALLAATCGTPYALDARGKILVVEEVGEAPYRIDRMWTQLSLAGRLSGVAGLALGRFTDVVDDGESLAELLARLSDELRVPAVMDLPFGHVDTCWTLPLGARARLDAGAGTIELLEPAVA